MSQAYGQRANSIGFTYHLQLSTPPPTQYLTHKQTNTPHFASINIANLFNGNTITCFQKTIKGE